jgi:hypothetical protein
MKVKLFEDGEFEVVGFTHGEGKYETCVKWICITPEGVQFAVNPKGTLKDKKRYLEHGDEFVGKKLTFRFFGKTEDGIPRIAVGHGFRHEEDLPADE